MVIFRFLKWVLEKNLLLKKDKLRQEDLNIDTPKLLLTLIGDTNIVASKKNNHIPQKHVLKCLGPNDTMFWVCLKIMLLKH